MPKEIAIVNNGNVVEVLMFDDYETAKELYVNYDLVESEPEIKGIPETGGTWDGQKFSPKPETVVVQEETQEPVVE